MAPSAFKSYLTHIVILSATVSTVADAATGPKKDTNMPASTRVRPPGNTDSITGAEFERNHWYNIEKSAVVYPTAYADAEGKEVASKVNQPLMLVEGTEFLVVGVDIKKRQATIAFNLEGQDSDDENPLPSEITVSLDDLNGGHSVPISFEKPGANNASVDADDADDQQELTFLEQMGISNTDFAGPGRARRARRGRALRTEAAPDGRVSGRVVRVQSKNGMSMCLTEVRINAGTICGQVMPKTERAADGYNLYKGAGWTPTAFDPDASPICTACFWKGGRTDCSGGTECGHASLKIGDKNSRGGNQWIGAGIRPIPQLPDHEGCSKKHGHTVCRVPYELEGCLVAPGHS